MTDKRCVYQEQITTYLDGELERETAAQFKEHIESCPQCSQELKEWEGVFDLLKLPEEEPGPGFTKSVLNALHRQKGETADLKQNPLILHDPWNIKNLTLVLSAIFLLAFSITSWLLTGAEQLLLIHHISRFVGIFVDTVFSLLPAPLAAWLYQVGNYLSLFADAVLTGLQQKLLLLLSWGETFFMLIRLLPPTAWVFMLVTGFIACLILGRLLENKTA